MSLYLIGFRKLSEEQEQRLIRHYEEVASMSRELRQGLSDEQTKWFLEKIKRLINRSDNLFFYLSSPCEPLRVISSRSLNKSGTTIADYVEILRFSEAARFKILAQNKVDRIISFARVDELNISKKFPFFSIRRIIKEEFFPEEIRSAFAN